MASYGELNINQKSKLSLELSKATDNADWFTVGIMAASANLALIVLEEIINSFNWPKI